MKHCIIIMILFLFGCKSKQFCIEENSNLSIKEGFYKEIPSGVAEGNSTIEMALFFNDFNDENIIIKSFYFRNLHLENAFSYKDYMLKTSFELIQNKDEIPFQLENNEVVIHYMEKEKSKYVKFDLKKQQNSLDNIPMEKN